MAVGNRFRPPSLRLRRGRAKAAHANTNVVKLDASCVEALPREPQLTQHVDDMQEAPADRQRRLAWIRHFVHTNESSRAWDLGWDGRPYDHQASVPYPKSLEKGSVRWDQLPIRIEKAIRLET